jgi:hypothetical protein
MHKLSRPINERALKMTNQETTIIGEVRAFEDSRHFSNTTLNRGVTIAVNSKSALSLVRGEEEEEGERN